MRKVAVADGSRRKAQEPTISWGLPEALALRVSQSLGTFWQRLREVWESND